MSEAEVNPRAGSHLWEGLHASLGNQIDETLDIFGEAYVLFTQAALAMDSAVYHGAYLLCRATIETAFYSFLTRRWNDGKAVSEIPKTLGREVRTIYFAEVAEAIKKRNILSEDQDRAVARIQEHGNFIAHLANRQEKQTRSFAKNAARLVQQMSSKGSHKSEIIEAFRKLGKDSMFWMDATRVLEDLRDTASILHTLINIAYSEKPKS